MRTHTFIPGEIPTLQRGLREAKEVGSRLCLPVSGDVKGEVRVWIASVGLTAVDGGVDLESDVEELAGKEINPKLPVSYMGCDDGG